MGLPLIFHALINLNYLPYTHSVGNLTISPITTNIPSLLIFTTAFSATFHVYILNDKIMSIIVESRYFYTTISKTVTCILYVLTNL